MAKNIAASRQKKPGGLSDKVSDIVLVVICAAVMLIVAYPLYYVLVASFSDPYDVYAGKTFLLPSQFTLKGYQAVFADSALFSGFINSIKYTVIGTIYSVVMIYLVAYPLSVKDLPGRKYISLFFVITMYFGGGMVPTYMLVKSLHLTNSPLIMIVMGAVSVYNVIITRTFFENSIPNELQEAAELDGCSHFKYFSAIVLPLSKAVISVITLYYAVGHWNDFFTALLYLNRDEYQPLQTVLRNILISNQAMAGTTGMGEGSYAQQYADQIKFAVIIVSTMPVLCIYPFIQKYFEKGVMIGAVKG